MLIYFLVEDASGKVLLSKIMEKYNLETPNFTIDYNILPYKGIGGFKKGKNVLNIKNEQLLNDLPKRMRALQNINRGKKDVSIFVVLDNDDRNTDDFRKKLDSVATNNNIEIDHVFCIAIEEMEAWLLGDRRAIQQAFPKLSDRIASKYSGYKQDSICGTWEYLADMITKGGLSKFQKKNPSSSDVGHSKSQWADNIGEHLDIRQNNSPSFMEFISELDIRKENFLCSTK